MNQHREKAVELLDHYVTLLMKRTGMKPDNDTRVELAECVDQIIEASYDTTLQRLSSALKDAKLL